MAQQLTATEWQNKIRNEFIPNCPECSSVIDKETLLACLFNAVINESQKQQKAANAHYERIALIGGCNHNKANAIITAFIKWMEELHKTA